MRTPIKLAAYGGILAVAFAGALGTGSVIGSPVLPAEETHSMGEMNAGGTSSEAAHGETHSEPQPAQPAASDALPGGLMVSERGYTLQPETGILPAGPDTQLNFQILSADGEPLTEYEQSHDKDMHLIAVRSDTTGFQHVHPELSEDGTWGVPLDLTAGTWRVFADFVPGDGNTPGEALTLGVDIEVAGDYTPEELPAVSRTAEVDGYSVTLDGDMVPGTESELTLSVSRDGEPVTDLEPYLAAYGHLVALRGGDLAYLHVHPAGTPDDGETESGPDITFYTTVPSSGDYRLYLDFQHDGVVRTAEFTATADQAETPADSSEEAPEQEETTNEGHADH